MYRAAANAIADHSGRAVKGMIFLRSLERWDHVF
jgi:hypothetical protein